jgi:hypothetical protein
MRLTCLRQLSLFLVLLVVAPRLCAELRIATPVVDLGEIRGGRRLAHRFELRNEGAGPVKIIEVQRGCGCLAPRLEESVLEPGAKTTLHFELRTLGQAEGPHTWNATVRYREAAEVKSLALALRGTIRSEVTVQPAILGLIVEKSARSEIVLTDARARPLRVTGAEARSPAVKVAEIIPDGKTTKIVLTADVEALAPGRHEGMLHIFTDDAEYEELQVPVLVTKTRPAAVGIVPEAPQVRLAAGAASGSALVRLRSLTGAPVRVAAIEGEGSAITATAAAGPGNDATMRILVRREAGALPASRRQVRVTLEGGEVVLIPVQVVEE